MRAYLVRIGVDQAFGGWNAPMNPETREFVYVPIPSEKVGGERGIRTLGRVSPTHAFQACSFNHSDISPYL
jgi:hypothetical protein